MEKTILLTRSGLATKRWGAALAAQGWGYIIDPLLTIEATTTPRPSGKYDAILITSANAPNVLLGQKENIGDLLSLPCFCVGKITATAARVAGFTHIHYGKSNSADLACKLIAKHANKITTILHITSDNVDKKAHNILSKNSINLVSWPLYRAIASKNLTPKTQSLIKQGKINAIPVFSPRSAKILVDIINKNDLTDACRSIIAVGLSQAVANVLQTLPWRRLCVASLPDEKNILACLRSELA